jgi:purine-binding chemotaxis protein CheW
MNALVFTVESHRYAVPLAQVGEVVQAVHVRLTDYPSMVAEGFVNVRGEVVPVIALRTRFGHPPRAVQPSEFFILVRAGSRRVVLRSDSLPALAHIPPLSSHEHDALGRASAGVVPMSDGLAFFQDLDQFLSTEDEVVIDLMMLQQRQLA